MLRAITNSVGAAMWFNCILVLTHANEAPPDSSNGPIQYETYMNQRTHALQQTIRSGRTAPATMPWGLYIQLPLITNILAKCTSLPLDMGYSFTCLHCVHAMAFVMRSSCNAFACLQVCRW